MKLVIDGYTVTREMVMVGLGIDLVVYGTIFYFVRRRKRGKF